MKKISLLFFTLFLILGVNQNLFAQGYGVTLTVFEPLPEVDFAAFAMTNNLSGAPTIISIEPSTPTPGERIIIEGKIEWKRDENDGFNQLFWFRTQAFAARNISNNDIGVAVRIAENQVNSSLAQENVSKGKPTGVYRFSVTLRDANGARRGTDEKTISFLNPTQTLAIRSPEIGSNQDIGNVIASWDAVIGASYYGLKANVRTRTSQGLEEALNSGNPLIDKDNVGNITMVSLRQYLEREWLSGQEIVFQISAFVDGAGGGRTLYSNIVNFFVGSSGSQLDAQLSGLLETLSDLLGQDLLQRFKDGNVNLNNIRVTMDDGRIISMVELTEILNYLKTNPNSIISVSMLQR